MHSPFRNHWEACKCFEIAISGTKPDRRSSRFLEKFFPAATAQGRKITAAAETNMARARRKGRHAQDAAGERGQHVNVPEDTNVPILLPKSLAATREVEQVCSH